MIFVGGTVASFLPLYWLIAKLTRKRPQVTDKSRPVPQPKNSNGEFLHLLRREALARVAVSLDAAVKELRKPGSTPGGLGLSEETRQRLADISQLVDSLFPSEPSARFGRHVSSLSHAAPSRIATLSKENAAIISVLKAALAPLAVPPPPTAPQLGNSWSARFRPTTATMGA